MEVRGVSLAYLSSLKVDPSANFYAVRDKVEELTGSGSLADYLLREHDNKHLVGKADYFVSYAWMGSYGATMSALKKHFEGKPDPFLWMDVAVVDQHKARASLKLDFDHWAEIFRESLKEIGRALLVLVPGEEPFAVTRSWCCFEWTCVKELSLPFEYCVNPEDVERIISNITENGMTRGGFTSILSKINVESASASEPSDQQAILKLMRNIGIRKVNDIIMSSVKEWLLQVIGKGQQDSKSGTKKHVALLMAKGGLHETLGEYNLAESFYLEALESAKQVSDYGEISTFTADIRREIAWILKMKGDFNGAERFIKEALNLVHREDNIARIAVYLDTYGTILFEKGDYTRAEACFQSSLDLYKMIDDKGSLLVASTLNNIASLRCDIKSDYAGAEALFREALEIREKHLGENHPEVAKSYHNLALILEKKGEYDEAENLYRKALHVRKLVLGDEHPDVAQTLNSLAIIQDHHRSDYNDAKQLAQEALAIRRKALGEQHLDTAESLTTLAAICLRMGDDDVEPLFRNALIIRKGILGGDHPEVASSLNNLADVYRKKCNWDEALRHCHEALDIYKTALRENHSYVASTLATLGNLYSDKGDLDGAVQYYQEALAIRRRALGETHQDVAETLNGLAGVLVSQGKYDDAESHYRGALAIQQRALGDDHPQALSSLTGLAGLLKKKGDYENAKILYRKVIAHCQRAYGFQDDDPSVSSLLQSIEKLGQGAAT